MPSAPLSESPANHSAATERTSQIDTAFHQSRQLYAAFELLRTDHMFGGAVYLIEPLLRSFCELALLILTDSSNSVSCHRDAIEQLRQQRPSNAHMENNMKKVVEHLQRMSAETCTTATSAKTFSDNAWQVLRLLRTVLRRERRTTMDTARLRKKIILAVLLVGVAISSGFGMRAYYRHWLAASVSPDTLQRIKDIENLQGALFKFKKDHGYFPSTEGRWDGLYTTYGKSSEDWIPGLVPKYIDKLPRDPRNHTAMNEQYFYWSDGVDYKLIAHNTPDARIVQLVRPEMYDSAREGRSFGVWSPSAAGR